MAGGAALDCAKDVVGHSLACGITKKKAPSSDVDLTTEDAQIAAVMAQLDEDNATLDRIRKQLHSEMAVADQMVAEQVLVPRCVVDELKQTANSFTPAAHQDFGADSSDDEAEAVTLGKSEGLQNQTICPGGYPNVIEIPKAGVDNDGEAWSRQRGTLPPLLYSASTGKLGDSKKIRSLSASKKLRPPTPALQLSPDVVIFEGCRIGSTSEATVELRNVSKGGMKLSMLPCTNRVFTNDPLRFDSATRRKLGLATGLIPPGVSVYLTVKFTPKTLDDQSDQLVITSELGNVSLPVRACGVQPPSLNAR